MNENKPIYKIKKPKIKIVKPLPRSQKNKKANSKRQNERKISSAIPTKNRKMTAPPMEDTDEYKKIKKGILNNKGLSIHNRFESYFKSEPVNINGTNYLVSTELFASSTKDLNSDTQDIIYQDQQSYFFRSQNPPKNAYPSLYDPNKAKLIRMTGSIIISGVTADKIEELKNNYRIKLIHKIEHLGRFIIISNDQNPLEIYKQIESQVQNLELEVVTGGFFEK